MRLVTLHASRRTDWAAGLGLRVLGFESCYREGGIREEQLDDGTPSSVTAAQRRECHQQQG